MPAAAGDCSLAPLASPSAAVLHVRRTVVACTRREMRDTERVANDMTAREERERMGTATASRREAEREREEGLPLASPDCLCASTAVSHTPIPKNSVQTNPAQPDKSYAENILLFSEVRIVLYTKSRD